jgi:hypothetical protein
MEAGGTHAQGLVTSRPAGHETIRQMAYRRALRKIQLRTSDAKLTGMASFCYLTGCDGGTDSVMQHGITAPTHPP